MHEISFTFHSMVVFAETLKTGASKSESSDLMVSSSSPLRVADCFHKGRLLVRILGFLDAKAGGLFKCPQLLTT